MNKLMSLLLLLFLTLSGPVVAQDQRGKIIDFVDNTNARIVIDDTEYRMALNMRVIGSGSQSLNRYALRPGQQVGIKVGPESGEVPVLTLIKIIQ